MILYVCHGDLRWLFLGKLSFYLPHYLFLAIFNNRRLARKVAGLDAISCPSVYTGSIPLLLSSEDFSLGLLRLLRSGVYRSFRVAPRF